MKWYWVLIIVAACFWVVSSLIDTAYDKGKETGEIEALQKYYMQTGVCMPEIGNIIRICDEKLRNVSQNYNGGAK